MSVQYVRFRSKAWGTDVSQPKIWGHTMESIFEFHPTGRTLLFYSEFMFAILIIALLARLAHSILTMTREKKPLKTRYQLG